MRRLVCKSLDTIHHYKLTKYDNSSSHVFTEIFDKKLHYSKNGEKENRSNTKTISTQYIIINLRTKYDYSNLHSYKEIFDENFIIQYIERKQIGHKQERISIRRLVRNPTIQYIINIFITTLTTLPCTVSQKSLTKNFIIQSMER